MELVFDFTSAASLLAFKPACALADELGIAIDWLPFAAPARAAPQRPRAGEEEAAGERHLRVRAEYVARDTARYARVQGLELRRDAEGVDAALARAGCLWANRHGVGREYVERVLLQFWAARLDIEDRPAIAAALAESGAPAFDDDAVAVAATALAAQQTALQERGIFNVPTFLVADQVFIGRQHLPMIRSLLTG